ncbi:cytochrome P450 [Novosphingobium sp. G106]|uniref:cytochrome P450 n=1 Tax=Novosphingobium sp. G106 TaxID=2849500 RepID=UPI001C2D3206|nr:cytochrome P450 [Novosphingobium sp. G106]MBV1687342.1 cytochrome P450 [Novosphingobium sp. G106]
MPVPDHIRDTIVDIRAYSDGRIYDAYKWLRANDPLGRVEAEGFDPFRVVTRHADIQEISRQNELFTNGPQSILFTQAHIEQTVRESGGVTVKSLIQMDAAEHQAYRGLTNAWFQPGNIKHLEGRIRELARAAADRMAASGGRCDFVGEIALHYPLLVIMEILGLPEADEPLMLKLTQGLFAAADPDELDADGKPPVRETDRAALFEMMVYFNKLTEERRANPTSDLASAIANGTIDGAPLDPLAMMGYYIIVATAGHDTTSSSTAGAMWALAQDPEQFAQLKADPSLIGPMIDEAIRWTTPVKHFMRNATADCEVGGQKIAKGDWLMLCYGSANRDEAVFPDPERFRIDRKPNRHVAFGYGAHLCLGQYLARMEMRILFEELLPRLQSVELDGDARMSAATFVNGPIRLPIHYVMN